MRNELNKAFFELGKKQNITNKRMKKIETEQFDLFMKINELRKKMYHIHKKACELERTADIFRGYITALIVINIFLLTYILLS